MIGPDRPTRRWLVMKITLRARRIPGACVCVRIIPIWRADVRELPQNSLHFRFGRATN